MNTRPLFLFVCLVLLSDFSLAQKNSSNDAVEAPLKVQMWFYGRYENVLDVTWVEKEVAGELHYMASFKKKEKDIVVLYNKLGVIKEEIVFNKKPVLTTGIKTYIDQKFSKFKVLGLKLVKIFDGTQRGKGFTTYYELLGRDKKEAVSFWFNDANEIINKNDFANYASLD